MNTVRTNRWQILAVVAVAVRLAAAAPTVPQARAALQQTARQTGMMTYERTLPSGAKRQYVNPSGPDAMAALERATARGSNVLEIMHFGYPGAPTHSLARFDGQLLHTQTSNWSKWRLRSWGDRLRPSAHKLYSAMIQLTDKEAANLRAQIRLAVEEQGPEPHGDWGTAHMKNAFAADRGINCTSTWSGVPIGEKGEPLSKLLGLGHSSGDPHGFQRALEGEANDRVFGIAVYGPKLGDFAARLEEPKFQF